MYNIHKEFRVIVWSQPRVPVPAASIPLEINQHHLCKREVVGGSLCHAWRLQNLHYQRERAVCPDGRILFSNGSECFPADACVTTRGARDVGSTCHANPNTVNTIQERYRVSLGPPELKKTG